MKEGGGVKETIILVAIGLPLEALRLIKGFLGEDGPLMAWNAWSSHGYSIFRPLSLLSKHHPTITKDGNNTEPTNDHQGLYSSLECLRLLTNESRVETKWIVDFLQHHTTSMLLELELCMKGEDVIAFLEAIEGGVGVCPGLRRLTLQLSGKVPIGKILDIMAQPASRLLRLEMLKLSIDPHDHESLDELFSVDIWTSSSLLRQQATALILADMLLPSFALVVVLPPEYVRAATSGVLHLLMDNDRLVMDRIALLRVLAELVEERFDASFTNIQQQAMSLAAVLEECLQGCTKMKQKQQQQQQQQQQQVNRAYIWALRAWYNLRHTTKHIARTEPCRQFVEELGVCMVKKGPIISLLLKLICEKPWDEGYMAVTCLDAIPSFVYQSSHVYDGLSKDMASLHAFVDIGRSPLAYRMNDAFASVICKMLAVDESFGHTLIKAHGIQLVLMILNWPAVRLYMRGGGKPGTMMIDTCRHPALLQRVFDMDKKLFHQVSNLLLSKASVLPEPCCKAFTAANAVLSLRYSPPLRGSLVCRYIIMLAALEDCESRGGGSASPSLSSSLSSSQRKKASDIVHIASRIEESHREQQSRSSLLAQLLIKDEAQRTCLSLLSHHGSFLNEGFYQETASVINILLRRMPEVVKSGLLAPAIPAPPPLRDDVGGDRDQLMAAFLFVLACTDLSCRSVSMVAQDFFYSFILIAHEIYMYAVSSKQQESYAYYPCGKGVIPRLDLVVQAFANLIFWVNEEDYSVLVDRLLSTASGKALMDLILDALEVGLARPRATLKKKRFWIGR